MPEIWDRLATARRQKALCANDVEIIREACRQNHNHAHVVECSECYGQVLDRMETRYTSSPDSECFVGQDGFTKELHELFAQARGRRTGGLSGIEERIAVGRHARVRQTVKDSQVIKHLLRECGRTNLLQRIDADGAELEAVLGEIRSSLDGKSATSRDLDRFLGRLAGISTRQAEDAALLEDIYQIFFSDYESSPVATGGTTERERLQRGSSLDAILEHRLERSVASKASSEVKEKHRRRLDELRRAQMAYENEKTKKTKDRQAADRPQSPSSPLELPLCATCQGPADSKSFFSCPLCQLRADLDDQWPLTVYCSNICYHQGFYSHLGEAHVCAAGDDCIQLRAEDGEVDSEGSLVLCNDCLGSLKIATPYCSKECGEIDFQHHRESVHRRQTEKGKTEHGDGDTSMSNGHDGSNWHLDNIEDHLSPLREALMDLEQRTSIVIRPVD